MLKTNICETPIPIHLLRFHFRPVVVTCSTCAPRGTKLHHPPRVLTSTSPTFIWCEPGISSHVRDSLANWYTGILPKMSFALYKVFKFARIWSSRPEVSHTAIIPSSCWESMRKNCINYSTLWFTFAPISTLRMQYLKQFLGADFNTVKMCVHILIGNLNNKWHCSVMQTMRECIESGIYTNFSYISEAMKILANSVGTTFLIQIPWFSINTRKSEIEKIHSWKANTIKSQCSAFQTFMITH